MTVGALDERSALHRHRVRDQRCTHNTVVFVEQYAGEEVKMTAPEVAERGELPRLIEASHSPPLDLVARAVPADGVDVGVRLAGLRPAKSLAEQIFGQIAGRVVGATGDTSCA